MGFTPPNPGFQSNTVPIVRRLSWVPVEGDIGELAGGWLAIAGSDDGRALWCAGAGHAPTGLLPRYVSREAHIAILEGTPLQDGRLAWKGARWTLADVAEGGRLVARLVAEGTAA